VTKRARWPLAVCGVMPAPRASSDAVSARPSISACSIPARAGSPASAATSVNADWLVIDHSLSGQPQSTLFRDADASATTVTFSATVEQAPVIERTS